MKAPRTSKTLVTGIFLLMAVPVLATSTEHRQIAGPFDSAQALTQQCLQCHERQGQDILKSSHWTWKRQRTTSEGTVTYSKKNGLSTFAVAAGANPTRCLTCHISTNLLTERFDPTAAVNIDCLVCHDTTGTYNRKLGMPSPNLDLLYIAKNVGTPVAANCRTCHDRTCGLATQSDQGISEKDVHLSHTDGAMNCQHCHPSQGRHAFSRTMHSGSGPKTLSSCSACHTNIPHGQKELNEHTEFIGCQTCHIPLYGQSQPALLSWNWAGATNTITYQNHSSRQVPLIDENGFTLATDIQPQYFWDDGRDTVYQRGVKISNAEVTVLQGPSARTVQSRILPFSATQSTQLFDAKYRYLISPMLSNNQQRKYIRNNWETTAAKGMKSLLLPFSGSYSFTPTLSYRRLNHGVVAAKLALDCMDCHGKKGQLNWQSLGYDNDPWSKTQNKNIQYTLPISTDSPSEATELPPIYETILSVSEEDSEGMQEERKDQDE